MGFFVQPWPCHLLLPSILLPTLSIGEVPKSNTALSLDTTPLPSHTCSLGTASRLGGLYTWYKSRSEAYCEATASNAYILRILQLKYYLAFLLPHPPLPPPPFPPPFPPFPLSPPPPPAIIVLTFPTGTTPTTSTSLRPLTSSPSLLATFSS